MEIRLQKSNANDIGPDNGKMIHPTNKKWEGVKRTMNMWSESSECHKYASSTSRNII